MIEQGIEEMGITHSTRVDQEPVSLRWGKLGSGDLGCQRH